MLKLVLYSYMRNYIFKKKNYECIVGKYVGTLCVGTRRDFSEHMQGFLDLKVYFEFATLLVARDHISISFVANEGEDVSLLFYLLNLEISKIFLS